MTQICLDMTATKKVPTKRLVRVDWRSTQQINVFQR